MRNILCKIKTPAVLLAESDLDVYLSSLNSVSPVPFFCSTLAGKLKASELRADTVLGTKSQIFSCVRKENSQCD